MGLIKKIDSLLNPVYDTTSSREAIKFSEKIHLVFLVIFLIVAAFCMSLLLYFFSIGIVAIFEINFWYGSISLFVVSIVGIFCLLRNYYS